jgi:hypothetical protein
MSSQSAVQDEERFLALFKQEEEWDEDWEVRYVSIYSCDRYVRVWSSTWGGGKGSVAKNIWWDLNGLSMGNGYFIRVVVGDTLLNPYHYDETEQKFQQLWDDDASSIKIVMVNVG